MQYGVVGIINEKETMQHQCMLPDIASLIF